MKKIVLIATIALLLTGCAGLDLVQKDAAVTPVETAQPAEAVALAPVSQKDFVELSAGILCLKVTAPSDTTAVRKAKANQLILKSGVTDTAFENYRAGLEKNLKQKEAVSYAIIGRIAELCPANAATVPAATVATPAPAIPADSTPAPSSDTTTTAPAGDVQPLSRPAQPVTVPADSAMAPLPVIPPSTLPDTLTPKTPTQDAQ